MLTFLSSTCFEPEGSSSGRILYIQFWYSRVCFTCISTSSLVGRLVSSIWNKLFYLQNVFDIQYNLLPIGCVRYRTHSSPYRTFSISNTLFTLQDVFDIEHTLHLTSLLILQHAQPTVPHL